MPTSKATPSCKSAPELRPSQLWTASIVRPWSVIRHADSLPSCWPNTHIFSPRAKAVFRRDYYPARFQRHPKHPDQHPYQAYYYLYSMQSSPPSESEAPQAGDGTQWGMGTQTLYLSAGAGRSADFIDFDDSDEEPRPRPERPLAARRERSAGQQPAGAGGSADFIDFEDSDEEPGPRSERRLAAPPERSAGQQPAHPALSDFQFTRKLGRGTWGNVYVARRRIDGHPCAVKVMSKRNCAISSLYDTLRKEAHILASLHHPFIVKIEAAFHSPDFLFIALELALGGTFNDLLESVAPMTPDFAKGYVCQIILALDYLHERGIVHGDLKPENLLMTSTGYMKLADFGLARRLDASSASPPNTLFGTPFYMAPEMIDGSSCGPSIDWWALGVILYQALFARYPFDLQRLPHSHHKFSRDDQNRLKLIISSGEYRIPYAVESGCQSFLKRLLSRSAGRRAALNRPRIVDEYVYFRAFDWDRLLAEKYPAPYRPADPLHALAPTDTDFSRRYRTPEAPQFPDPFPGLFDDFYYLPPDAPWA